MNPSENKVQSYESVREEPVNPSGYTAETYESVRNKTVQPPVNPSVNGYECVRGRLLIRPDTPVNLSEKNYINVRKHHPTLLAVNKLRNGLLYTPFTLCLYILKIINLNSDRYIGFVLENIREGNDSFMKDETRTFL